MSRRNADQPEAASGSSSNNRANAGPVLRSYSAFGKILSANPEVGKLNKDAIVVYAAQLGNAYPLVVGLLAAGVAHEVNTPLAGISSYVQMMQRKMPESDPRRPIL